MSTNPEARAWIQVRAGALRRNFARIREAVAPDVRILPMVKANAYGLGVREVVCNLEPLDPWGYGVATVEEGQGLRELGVTRPVVVCSPAPDRVLDAAVRHDLQPSISSLASLERLAGAARRAGRAASYHVDVDTGMGRSGFDWRSVEEWMPQVSRPDPVLRWVGISTHMHSADERPATVHEQWRRLEEVLEHAAPPPDGLMVHALNSAGIFRTPSYARAVVRPGIFLYGGRVGAGQPTPEPVVSIHARVVHVRDAAPGTTLGYGATYTASGPERWATLALGYGDGLPRALGNRGQALVGGARAPIIGRISMDVTVVDITGVPSVDVGTVATLMGTEGDKSITVDEIADQAGTISYEVLTGLTARLPRVWSVCHDASATAPASEAIA